MLLSVSCYWIEYSERSKVYYAPSDFYSNAIRDMVTTNLNQLIPVNNF
jgi:hypothetical protein